LRALTVRYGLRIGLVVSAALFAALHLGGDVGWVVVPLFAIGIILGWAYARTGNLLTNVTAHAVNNAIGVLLLYRSH
jgi:membrane protease YdiL (CAAX protease family)